MQPRNLNWPGGINRADSNWTGKTPRVSNLDGAWEPDSHRIPRIAWLGAAVIVLILFWLVPFIGYAAGF